MSEHGDVERARPQCSGAQLTMRLVLACVLARAAALRPEPVRHAPPRAPPRSRRALLRTLSLAPLGLAAPGTRGVARRMTRRAQGALKRISVLPGELSEGSNWMKLMLRTHS